MFKFYSILRNTGGRNNYGLTTVRYRGRPLKSKVSVNYFNFREVAYSNFYAYIPGSLATSYVNYANRSFNFIFSKFKSRPLQLFQFLPGTFVSNIEAYPGSGSRYVRAPYSRAIIIRRLGTNSIVKIPSGEIRKFKAVCFGYKSLNDSFFAYKTPLLKAGNSRKLGIRPHVRGCAINPVDHPHGGRTGESRPSVSPWAQLTKGYRTRLVEKNKKVVVISVQELKNRKQNAKRT
mgnify:CR=1 FL=1